MRDLNQPLAAMFASTLKKHQCSAFAIIPNRKESQRNRGWFPMDELARRLETHHGIAYVRDAFEWKTQPLEQRDLTNAQRQVNITQNLVARDVECPDIWLIDDVWTTGATLLGATTALADKGGHVAGLSVLAVSRQKVLVNAQACV